MKNNWLVGVGRRKGASFPRYYAAARREGTQPATNQRSWCAENDFASIDDKRVKCLVAWTDKHIRQKVATTTSTTIHSYGSWMDGWTRHA